MAAAEDKAWSAHRATGDRGLAIGAPRLGWVHARGKLGLGWVLAQREVFFLFFLLSLVFIFYFFFLSLLFLNPNSNSNMI
jgi:hypothetical protein